MRTIDISAEEGSISGYVVGSDEEQVINWFQKHKVDPRPFLQDRTETTLAFLDTMHVEEGYRNQGIGTDLLSRFIDEAVLEGAEQILLMCDKAESQDDGFDLQDWYEAWDFEVVECLKTPEEFPIMIRKAKMCYY